MPSARKRATVRANHHDAPAEQAVSEPHTTPCSPQAEACNGAHNTTDSAAAGAASSSPTAASPRVPAWWESGILPPDAHQSKVRAVLKDLVAAAEPFAHLLMEIQLLAERLADAPLPTRIAATLRERLDPIGADLLAFLHYSTAADTALSLHFSSAAFPVLLKETWSQIQSMIANAEALAVGAEACFDNPPNDLMRDIRHAASKVRAVAQCWVARAPQACERILACKGLVPASTANALEAQLLQLRQSTGSHATLWATNAGRPAIANTQASDSQSVPSTQDASRLLASIMHDTRSSLMAQVQWFVTRIARGEQGAADHSMPQIAHFDKTAVEHSQSFRALQMLQTLQATSEVLATCIRTSLSVGHASDVAAQSLSASAHALGADVCSGYLSLKYIPLGRLPLCGLQRLAVSTAMMAECTVALEATTVGQGLIPPGVLASKITEGVEVAREMAQLIACWPVEGPPNTRTPGAAGAQQPDAGTSVATATSLRAAHGGAVALPCAELLASSEQQTPSPAAAARQGLCKRVVQICIHLHNAPASEVTCGMRSGAALHTLARAVCLE